MMKRILILLMVVVIAGCNGHSRKQWDNHATYGTEAQSAPSVLTADSTTEQGGQVYQPYSPAGETEMNRQPASNQVANQQMAGTIPSMQNAPSDFNSVDSGQAYMQEQAYAAPSLPPIKVALLLPMSGKHSDLGEAMLQSAQLALFDMGYDAFELMPRDTRGTSQGAAQAAQSAINDGAQLILGPLFSHSVAAAKPYAQRNNINMVAFSTDWSLAGGNTYIMGFLPFAQVKRVTEYAFSQGYRNIGILAPNNEYGNAVISAYNSLAYRTGSSRANVARYSAGGDDTSTVIRTFTRYDQRVQGLSERRSELESILSRNPNDQSAKAELASLKGMDAGGESPFDAILLPVGGDQARSVGNMLSHYDLGPKTVKRLGTGLWDDPGLATEPALAGGWYAAPSPDLRRDFERRYQELYGLRPQRLATLAYDATALAAVIAKKSYLRTGRVAFERNELINPNGYAGIDGIFRFRPDGMIERGLAVLEFRDASAQVIDPAPTTFQRMDY